MKKNYILVMTVLIIVSTLSATYAALQGNNVPDKEAAPTTLDISRSTTNFVDISGSSIKLPESDYDQWKPGDPITEEIIEEIMNKPVNDLTLRDYQILYEWQKSWQDQDDAHFDSTLTIDGSSTVYEFTKNAKDYLDDPSSSGYDIIIKPANPYIDIGIGDPNQYYIIDISSN